MDGNAKEEEEEEEAASRLHSELLAQARTRCAPSAEFATKKVLAKREDCNR